MSLKRDRNLYMPHTIRIFKKDITLNKHGPTQVPIIEKRQSFYYNQYIEAFHTLDFSKGKAVIRSMSHYQKEEAYFQLQGRIKIQDDDYQPTFSETIRHDVFPIRGSKKSIFRMKVTRNTRDGSNKQKRRELSMMMNELRIAPKLLKVRQCPTFSLSKQITTDAGKGRKAAKLTLQTSHIPYDYDTSAVMDSISPW